MKRVEDAIRTIFASGGESEMEIWCGKGGEWVLKVLKCLREWELCGCQYCALSLLLLEIKMLEKVECQWEFFVVYILPKIISLFLYKNITKSAKLDSHLNKLRFLVFLNRSVCENWSNNKYTKRVIIL